MMYLRFPLSLRNVEDLLNEGGIEISYETVRFRWNRFGPLFAAEVRKRRLSQIWRAADHEGDVLESFIIKRRDRTAALNFFRKIMKYHGHANVSVTDKLRPYGAVMKEIGNADRQETGRWLNNRAENSHQPFRRRERAMLRFRRMRTLQKFVTVHGSVHTHFNAVRHFHNRSNFKLNRVTALTEWRQLYVK
jgi:putative transposase